MVGVSKKGKEVEVVKPYRIIKEELPPPMREKQGIYTDLVNEILQMEKGTYRIEVEGKHFKTIYSALVKRIKGKPLKIHVRKQKVYLERL
jgi:hypothetical protein